MSNRVIAGLLALGIIIGAITVFPLARASQPVKTVTKTQKVTSVSKVENGMPLPQVLTHFGTPAAVTRKPTPQDNGVECVAWVSKTGGQPQRGDWELSLCVKTQ
jgi:hypothetical protein